MSFTRSKFRAHEKAHKTVIAHERWFQKDAPFLGKPFSVKKTVERHAAVIKILSRAGKRAARAGNQQPMPTAGCGLNYPLAVLAGVPARRPAQSAEERSTWCL
jgi:hypothetical protein